MKAFTSCDSARPSARLRIPAIASLFLFASVALAEESKPQPEYDETALKAALDEAPGTHKKTEKAGSALEVPPPPPRKSGIVVEGSLGAMGFLGKLKNVSPAASSLHLQLGFEPF